MLCSARIGCDFVRRSPFVDLGRSRLPLLEPRVWLWVREELRLWARSCWLKDGSLELPGGEDELFDAHSSDSESSQGSIVLRGGWLEG